MSVRHVIARRRAERDALLDRARAFAGHLPDELGVVAVAVFGSVARGDFNTWSDIDVLVIAERLPGRPLDRLAALGDCPGLVAPVAWTPAEWQHQRTRRNPIAVEVVSVGVVVRGLLPPQAA
jgi:predicted nucleotidyltransferase